MERSGILGKLHLRGKSRLQPAAYVSSLRESGNERHLPGTAPKSGGLSWAELNRLAVVGRNSRQVNLQTKTSSHNGSAETITYDKAISSQLSTYHARIGRTPM